MAQNVINQFQRLNLGDTRLQRFREKRIAVRKIGKQDIFKFPRCDCNVCDDCKQCYKSLRTLLGSQSTPPQDKTYKSPRDLVQMLVHHDDMNLETIKKLFEKQFEIKWNTSTEDPDPFSYYGFCRDVPEARRDNVRVHQTRKAHVLSMLYHAQEKLHEIRDLSHKELCPPVYVYKDGRWTKWKWDKTWGVNKFVQDQNPADIEWMTNIKMRTYITQTSMVADVDPNKKENHLYWAILEEDDIEEDDSDGSSKTQVYVGRTGRGIRSRWVEDTSSHCKNMERSRNFMYNMMHYAPETLKDQQLVDLRFLLHKADNVEGDNSGLFLMPPRQDKTLRQSESMDIEGVVMDDWFLEPLDMLHGMNCKRGERPSIE